MLAGKWATTALGYSGVFPYADVDVGADVGVGVEAGGATEAVEVGCCAQRSFGQRS